MPLRKGIDMCSTAISAVHKAPFFASLVMKDPTHVLHYQMTKRYQNLRRGTIDKEKEGLWLIVSANAMHRKRVVRVWAKRRIIAAITEQLKAQGFDAKGRKLEGAREQIMHDGLEIQSLVGSVNALVSDKSIDYKYEEVLRQAGLLVQDIIVQCGQRKRSLKSTKPTRSTRNRQPGPYPQPSISKDGDHPCAQDSPRATRKTAACTIVLPTTLAHQSGV